MIAILPHEIVYFVAVAVAFVGVLGWIVRGQWK
jgi:hypothetical protein